VSSGSAIVLDHVSKQFGSVTALDSVSFEVAPATIFGLLGPNGAGKTTAIRVLTTLLRPDAGRAAVLGLDVVRDAGKVRQVIGLAGQAAAVDANLTGRENLRLMGRLGQLSRAQFRRRADELLERFDLVGAAARPVRTYSGGMRRRLDIAAALVASPTVLFLDEPTTGLDLQSRNGLWDMIRELVHAGTTIVLTTQYLEEADQLADRIAVIDNGRVIANDTPVALKATLGSTVIEIGLPDEASAVRTGGVLSSLTATQVHVHDASVTLRSNQPTPTLVTALRLMEQAALEPTTLHVREPSLDDAFLQLTGHAATANGETR